MHLYEISTTMLEIMNKLEDAESEGMQEALQNALEEWEGDFDSKLLSVVGMAETLDAEAEALEAVAARKVKTAKAARAKADWLRSYALHQMKAIKKTEINTPELSVKIKTGSGAVEVYDSGKLPAWFFRIVPEHKEVDKAGLRVILMQMKKNGDAPELPGARLVFNEKLEVK